MEDCPLFNSGKGSVFSSDEIVEMDSSVMDGATGQAGAVAGVHRVRNPITAARAVMEKSKHVMMVGDKADAFAERCGLAMEGPSYFFVQSRWDQLQEIKRQEAASLLQNGTAGGEDHAFGIVQAELEHKFGTVGAVALDVHGNVAAGTSTGGMTNKRYGRVGDSPIIGAGTYAKNTTCAVSCTGHGEFFIRAVAAYSVSARMEFGRQSLSDAAHDVVMKELLSKGGEGGLIAVDTSGAVTMPFNCEGMYRGVVRVGESPHVWIYEDEL
jgi:beta-aspartyl-peptidase (threonine type)